MTTSERITLTFEPSKGVDLDSAARALLKRAWRSHGLRCVEARIVGGEACQRTQRPTDAPSAAGPAPGEACATGAAPRPAPPADATTPRPPQPATRPKPRPKPGRDTGERGAFGAGAGSVKHPTLRTAARTFPHPARQSPDATSRRPA